MIKKVVKVFISVVILVFLGGILGLNLFGIKHMVVLSDSMAPTIKTFSLAFIKTIDEEELKDIIKNKMILVVKGDQVDVLHRVVDYEDDVIYLKGDNNYYSDKPVAYDEVIGVYYFSIPLIGILFYTIYPFLIIILLILSYYTIKHIIILKGKNNENN